MIQMGKRTYRLHGMTRILGAQAANPKVHSEFIAAKAAKLAKGEEQTAMLPEANLETKGLTVFLRDDGALCLADYVIKGFLKEALGVIKGQVKLGNPTTKVDNLILVEPDYLHFTRGGKPVTEADEIFERPLRAMTMQGPRVSVSASETIRPDWELEFTLTLIDNERTAKSVALTWEIIEEALNYGAIKGLGQWRNGQNGRFGWEIVEA